MDNFVALQQKIAPELTKIIEMRYDILRQVFFTQPIGRRSLASKLSLQERAVRREVDFLREQGLVYIDGSGIRISNEGEGLLNQLSEYIRQLKGLSHLEESLQEMLNLKKVIIVPGDSDLDETVKKELARVASKYLKSIIKDGDVVAVTGGTTMAEVAEATICTGAKRNITVVPARGSLGEDVEKQADTVAALIAKRLGGQYKLLNIPDDLSHDIFSRIMGEPRIQEIIDIIRSANIVMHGVGTAEEMAKRRRLSPDQFAILKERKAVGEAFGFYFDSEGRTVYSTTSIGLRLEDLSKIENVIGVGGGHTKAEAVISVVLNRIQRVLITDEGATRRILELLRR